MKNSKNLDNHNVVLVAEKKKENKKESNEYLLYNRQS